MMTLLKRKESISAANTKLIPSSVVMTTLPRSLVPVGSPKKRGQDTTSLLRGLSNAWNLANNPRRTVLTEALKTSYSPTL
jgi:hypothetical protein